MKLDRLKKLVSEKNFDKYKKVLEKYVKKKEPYSLFDELDDFLLNLSKTKPDLTEKISYINLKIYKKYKKKNLHGYTFNTLLGALLTQNKISDFVQIFEKGLKYSIDNDLYHVGLSLVGNVKNAFNPNELKQDECIAILRKVVDFHLNFKKPKDAIGAMCDAAYFFCSFEAFQPAYRVLSDAQEIALKNELLEEQARIFDVQATVAFYENDFKYAIAHYEKSISLFIHLNKAIPEYVYSNLATAKLNISDFSGAKEIYNEILKQKATQKHQIENVILINLSICQRETGEIQAAVENIQQVINNLDVNSDLEVSIEAYLVATKLFIKIGEFEKAQNYLYESILFIDKNIASINRLHYRRAIRDKYCARIKALLHDIPKDFFNNKSLAILAFLKCNTYTDWVALLDWCDDCFNDTSFPNLLRIELKENLESVIQLGAPVLYGFREKYDDPFEAPTDNIENEKSKRLLEATDYSLPWNKFNLSLHKVKKETNKSHPYNYARVLNLVGVLRKKLSGNSALLFILTGKDYCYFYYIASNDVNILKANVQPILEFHVSLIKYRSKEINYIEFIRDLNKTIDFLNKSVSYIADSILTSQPKELLIFPDLYTDNLPLVAAILSNSDIRKHVKSNNFSIKVCPIIYPQKERKPRFKNFLGLYDSHSGLPLINDELNSSSQLNTIEKRTLSDLREANLDYSSDDLSDADIIHISMHGSPISNFTDPIFASISGPELSNSLSLEEINLHFFKYNYELAIINACDSSDKVSKNYFKIFKSNELIGYSTSLLLNRKASVISLGWPTMDLVCFVFSFLYYKNLSINKNIYYSYVLSLIDLIDLDVDGIIDILSNIQNDELRNKKIEIFNKVNQRNPFNTPYCYGSFILSCLL
jgi:hypothetical protein